MSTDPVRESYSSVAQEWAIPAWLKIFLFLAALGDLFIVIGGLNTSIKEQFGIPISIVIGVTLPLFFLLISIAISFVCFPTSQYARMDYWILRFLRDQVTVLSLFGMLYLLVIRIPILSFSGGFAWITLFSLFVVGLFVKPARLSEMINYDRLWTWSSLNGVLSTFRRIPVWVPQLIIALIPVGLVLFFIYFVLGSGLSHYGPYSPNNDEVGYWVWLRSYHDVGFKSGYNVPNERLPFFTFSRYGEQSPVYLYLYGFITKWINWFPALPVLVNFLLLSISIFLFFRSLKLTLGQTLLAGCAIVLTGPVLLYLPITMHETLNQAIGILLAIMIARLLLDRERLSPVGRLAIVLFALFATLVRVSWGLLLVPILFYCLNGKLAWRVILALLLGAGLFLSVVVLTNYFTPPINDTIRHTLNNWTRGGMEALIGKIYTQFSLVFQPRQLSPNLGTLFQMAVATGWGIASSVNSIRSKKAELSTILHSFEVFDVYNMVSLGVAGLTFYAYINFHRTFAPALLIFYLLLVKRGDYKHLTALLMVSFLLFPLYLNNKIPGIENYELIRADYTRQIPQSVTIQKEIRKFIVYDPEASNPWCNTVLIPLRFYDSRLTLFPSGIGISYLIDAGLTQTPIKSHYALFDQHTFETYRDTTHLDLLVSLPIGDLYQNQEANCPLQHDAGKSIQVYAR